MFKDLDQLNRRATFHAIFDDQIIGITQKDRTKKIRSHVFWIFVLLLIIVDCTYILYWLYHLHDKMGDVDIEGHLWLKTKIFMYIVVGISSIRIIGRTYLICKWRNKNIDPTMIESRCGLYAFFSVGLLELANLIFGFIVLNEFSDHLKEI